MQSLQLLKRIDFFQKKSFLYRKLTRPVSEVVPRRGEGQPDVPLPLRVEPRPEVRHRGGRVHVRDLHGGGGGGGDGAAVGGVVDGAGGKGEVASGGREGLHGDLGERDIMLNLCAKLICVLIFFKVFVLSGAYNCI